MRDDFSVLRNRLHCPDDSTRLVFDPGQFCCPSCARVFPFHKGVLELLPSKPAIDASSFNDEYASEYQRATEAPLRLDESSLSWGAPEAMPRSWIDRRDRQVRSILDLLKRNVDPATLVCDLSAGAGYYTFAMATEFRTVLHCDLSAENLGYAIHKAKSEGLDNILFIRADYFAVPFQSSLDVTLCLDTLIRGEEHERRVLASIVKATTQNGLAVIDFHNWWHNPLRRLGILRQNFGSNRSYTRNKVQQLLHRCGIKRYQYFPFHQEAEQSSLTGKLLRHCLPPTRFVYMVSPGLVA